MHVFGVLSLVCWTMMRILTPGEKGHYVRRRLHPWGLTFAVRRPLFPAPLERRERGELRLRVENGPKPPWPLAGEPRCT